MLNLKKTEEKDSSKSTAKYNVREEVGIAPTSLSEIKAGDAQGLYFTKDSWEEYLEVTKDEDVYKSLVNQKIIATPDVVKDIISYYEDLDSIIGDKLRQEDKYDKDVYDVYKSIKNNTNSNSKFLVLLPENLYDAFRTYHLFEKRLFSHIKHGHVFSYTSKRPPRYYHENYETFILKNCPTTFVHSIRTDNLSTSYLLYELHEISPKNPPNRPTKRVVGKPPPF